MEQWMSSEQAAARLGVKPETLYAYVSRGLLRSHPVPGPRRASRYERAEVERLAARRRSGGRAGAFELLVDTSLTFLDPAGRVCYRGWDVPEASRTASYERVAEWLWTGQDQGEPPAWRADPGAVDAARAATSALGREADLVDRMRVGAAVLATTDPLRHDRRPEAVALVGRGLISALVECLPPAGGGAAGAPPDLELPTGVLRADSVAGRLWGRLAGPPPRPGELAGRGPRPGELAGPPPRPGELAVLNAALVLLADHELAASTLAARVAASTWADPYLVIQTGLAVLGGPLHGGNVVTVRHLLAEVVATGSAAAVVGDRLRSGGRIPGFGHAVYRTFDPRARALIDQLRAAFPERSREPVPPALWAVEELLAVTAERDLPPPNVDLAVAAMCECLGLVEGAGEVVFAVARCSGWLAHAAEEYPHRLRYRPRAVYVGPAPSD